MEIAGNGAGNPYWLIFSTTVNFRSKYLWKVSMRNAESYYPKRNFGLVLLLMLSCSLLTGCVSRRLTIRTNPPGALVKLNGKRLGFSPVSTDFIYYGTYEVELIKDGYETETILQTVSPPWYQRFPLDFVSDNLLPFRKTNRHEYTWPLRPKSIVPTDDLLNRANQLRSEALIGL